VGEKPRVYLAGKIAKNDWRNDVVDGYPSYSVYYRRPCDGLPKDSIWLDRDSADGKALISGPFFITCDHGCQHGTSTHAMDGSCANANIDYSRRSAREWAAHLCLAAIRRSDVFYAWLDDDTAYGTIAEIGYAVGIGKTVVVATPVCHSTFSWEPDEESCRCAKHGDMWFATTMHGVQHIWADDAVSGYQVAIDSWYQQNAKFDSPVEKQFWDVAQLLALPELNGLIPQFEVGRYRLDFAIPSAKIGIEVDGLAFHNGQESFIADRRRQRHLESEGWRVIRFAAKEVMDDPTECVKQAGRIATVASAE